MRYSHRVAQLQKIAADAAYTHRAATYALRKLAADDPTIAAAAAAAESPATGRLGALLSKLPSLASIKDRGSKGLADLMAYQSGTFDSLQGAKVPGFLKKLTKGQAAGGALGLAALLGGGAMLMGGDSDDSENRKKQQEAEAAAAILAAKNLSEEQRRKLLRNLGIGAGAALGGYGLYRALK